MDEEPEGEMTQLDMETVMAEIKVASQDFAEFIEWAAHQHDIEPDEFKSVIELVYSFARQKNKPGE